MTDNELLQRKSGTGIAEYWTGIPQDNVKFTSYYFYYYYYGTSFKHADKVCRSKGEGWQVATFQTLFEFEDMDVKAYGDLYEKSLRNIE